MKLAELAEKRIHFIGLGGAGMSGIARIMLAKGINISGSDAKDSSVLSGLKTLGAQVFIGHAASNIGDADILIHFFDIRFNDLRYLKLNILTYFHVFFF